MDGIKALTFDTGGTILDWHSGISGKMRELAKLRGIEANWPAITNDHRLKTLMGMTGGGDEFHPDFNMDQTHRRLLPEVMESHAITGFTDEDYQAICDQWYQMPCWPDVPSGLARMRQKYIAASLTILSVRIIIESSKSNDITWDAVISCEMMGPYKPRPDAYLGAAKWLNLDPSECLMVAAHGFDLSAAAKAGFKTAFVKRPDEWGDLGEADFMKAEYTPDLIAEDFNDLADQLHCD